MGLHNSEEDIFSHSGPKHLTADSIDWKNDEHRMSVAACLVKGAYILEGDRQRKLEGDSSDDQAPPWWKTFDFELSENLYDDSGSTIVGAIYEYKPRLGPSVLYVRPPRYVIALRGTLIKRGTVFQDLRSCIQILGYRLHKISRFKILMKTVEKMVEEYGESDVWLAGHSLGAALAVLVGRAMAKRDIYLQSFLFNPPFKPEVSFSIGRIKSKKVKMGGRIVRNLFIYGLVAPLKAMRKCTFYPFDALSAWEPCLFVNPDDPFGSECISHFELRRDMEKIGLGKVDKVATQYSFRGLIKKVLGRSAEAFHLIPSANLTVNCTKGLDAHGINQWWRSDLVLHSTRYSCPTSTSYVTNEQADDIHLV